MNEICGDNRFEIIEKAKRDILDSTNISSSQDEMKVLDGFLFRCWQMRWLKKYDNSQPQTNADRIRAMSDEELAKILNAFTAYFEECNRSSSDVDCKDCELYKVCSLYEGNALEWLKQPAE